MKQMTTQHYDFFSSWRINFINLSTWLLFSFALFSHSNSVIANSQTSFERLWPKLEQPFYFDNPNDIALDNQRGFAYVINDGNNSISKFTQSGQFIKQWILTSFGDATPPATIAVDQDGFVYVAQRDGSRIQKFDGNGEYVADVLLDLSNSDINLGFIRGLAFAPNGSLYLVSGGQKQDDADHAVWIFTQDGEFIQSWGEFGAEPGKLGRILVNDPVDNDRIGPQDIAISKNGRVYIADTFNHRIQVFNLNGDFITGWGVEGDEEGQFHEPISVLVDNQNRVYVGDSNFRSEDIQRFTEDGVFIDRFFNSVGDPRGLAFDASNILFVADRSSNRIIQVNSSSELISSWQSASEKEGHFNFPLGIDTDVEGNIYVVDNNNDRVQKFSSDGTLAEIWQGNDYAFDRGRFDNPGYIAVGSNAFYLSDDNKIIKFDFAGKHLATWTDNIDVGTVYGMTIDNNEIIYVSLGIVENDKYFQRIAKFNTAGEFLSSWQWAVKPTGQPLGLEVGEDGFVYVVSEDQIYKFDLNGNFEMKWAVDLEPDGSIDFSAPPDIAIDQEGLIYTVHNLEVIRVFNSSGVLMDEFSQRGGSPGSINSAQGLTISNSGKLYVSDSFNHRVQKFDLGLELTPNPTNPISRKAVILAGGGPFPGNLIWDDTQILANRAYSALRFQGFAKNQIKYLTGGSTLIDLDNNGISDDAEAATRTSLNAAITEWATDANEVVLYMVDHGGPERFQINATQLFNAEDLQNLIDQLSDKIPGKVTVIIEACKSGSFIPAIAKTDRYIISSSSAEQAAIISNKGLNSFSYFFWNEISNGATLQQSFRQARQAMSSQLVKGIPQNAQLDSNGDAQFSSTDLNVLGDYCLGNCTTYAASAPRLLSVSPSTTLQGETSLDLQMQIQSLDNINSAWATIVRPDYQHPDSNEPVSDLPRIEFICNNAGLCTGRYDRFDVTGEYALSFYAQDQEYQLALPISTIIEQTKSNKAVYDSDFGVLTLNDVAAFGEHFRVELFNQGDFNFTVGAIQPLTNSTNDFAADYSDQSLVLLIPRVSAFGRDFTVIMSHQGNFVFTVGDVSDYVE